MRRWMRGRVMADWPPRMRPPLIIIMAVVGFLLFVHPPRAYWLGIVKATVFCLPMYPAPLIESFLTSFIKIWGHRTGSDVFSSSILNFIVL